MIPSQPLSFMRCRPVLESLVLANPRDILRDIDITVTSLMRVGVYARVQEYGGASAPARIRLQCES